MQNLDKYFILFTGTVAMFLLAISIVMFMVLYQKKMLKQQQEKQEAELKYQSELLFSNIKTLESERARLASDLHDEVGASLSALRMQLARMENRNQNISETGFADAKDIIDHTIENVKRISYNLLPPGLEQFGLVFVVNNLFGNIKKNTGFEAVANIPAALPRFSKTIELALYRVLQELTTNSIKHSGGSCLYFSISEIAGILAITYSDDGRGYDPAMMEKKANGLGLKNIHSRIRLIGGTIEWNTANEITIKLQTHEQDKNSIG